MKPYGSDRRLPARPSRPLLGAGSSEDSGQREGLVLDERRKAKRPRLYKVLLHNDDFTTMEFVVDVLVRYFHKTTAEATRVMLEVHRDGLGLAGIFTYEVAETKVAQVTAEARQEGMPLKCTVDPA
ncbi:MAG TPA: ATP-dependent Clp protease adapter ClpS [Thermoanaerobaculia bacterium]|nr:ATP-dependent Clp protease adapter ClpS [Thermoanaerobaculia bacterium]